MKTTNTKKSASTKATKSAPTTESASTNKKAAPPKRLSALDAAAQVLAGSKEPLTCKELVEQMQAQGLWQTTKGRTPEATLNASFHREIKLKGSASRFAKAGRGKFKLATKTT